MNAQNPSTAHPSPKTKPDRLQRRIDTHDMDQRITPKYFLIIFLSVMATLLLHEFGHYVVGVSLGYPMQMDLCNARPIGIAAYRSSLHANLVTLGGPSLTLLQTIIVTWMLLKRRILVLYPLAIAGPIVRVLAYLSGLFNQKIFIGEDEAKISASIGLPRIALPIVVLSILIGLVVYVHTRLKVSYKILIITAAVGVVSVMILFNVNARTWAQVSPGRPVGIIDERGNLLKPLKASGRTRGSYGNWG